MANELIKLRPLGINPDIPPSELTLDEYSGGKNITFRNKAAVRVDGYNNAAGTLLHPCDFVIGNRRPENIFYWIYPGDSTGIKIAVTDLVNHFDITPAVAPSDSTIGEWTGGELNGLLMLTNGVDAPWYWDGNTANPMLLLPNFPALTTAGWIRPFKYFAIAGDITSNGVRFENQFYWSATVLPGEPPTVWEPLPSNDAGDNILAGTPGTLVDGASLRDHFILAKNHSLFLLNYVGGQFVFTVHKLSETSGALSSNCMTEDKGFLYIFSDGDILKTDGQRIESIATQRIKRTIFDDMNQNAFKTCYVTNYVAQDEIWFCFPRGAAVIPNVAAVYDLVQGVWGVRELPNVNYIAEGIVSNVELSLDWNGDNQAWNDDPTVWNDSGISEIEDGLVMASQDDLLYGVGLSNTANGAIIDSYVEKISMDFEEVERIKLVTRVWPYIKGTPGDVCEIRMGSQKFESDPVAWSAPVDYVIGATEKVDTVAQGRLISMRVSGTTDNAWQMHAFDISYSVKGFF